MSGLAHYLEEEGIATTLVALVRVHAEKTRPPRALWVPFELGRPLGEPGDTAGQKRILTEALALLERTDGPVILEDYVTDNEGGTPDETWVSPIKTTNPVDRKPAALIAAFKSEIEAVWPFYEQNKAETGRTTFGTSGLDMSDIPDFVGAFLNSLDVTSPTEGVSATLVLRFAVDDIKTFYLEAATAGPGSPSSTQLTTWFWHETTASKVIAAVRAALLASDNRGMKMVGGGFLIPPMVAAALKL